MSRSRFRYHVAVIAVNVWIVTGCERGDRVPAEELEPERALTVDSADQDREFLRRMLEHHSSLTLISHAAAEQASSQEARRAAQYIDLRHDVERDRLRRLLRREFRDTLMPPVQPRGQSVADSLALLSGTEYDRAFREWVLAHHREAVRMIDGYLPRLRRPGVTSLAQEIRENQLREIRELEIELWGR